MVSASMAVGIGWPRLDAFDPDNGEMPSPLGVPADSGTAFDGELWHGTLEHNDSDLRRIDPTSCEVLERLDMPTGAGVSGLESIGDNRFFCSGGDSAPVRSIRRATRIVR